MESNKISPDDVTEREKIAALKTLGDELGASLEIKDKQLRVSTKLNNRTMLILILHSILLAIMISVSCYLIFRPLPATIMNINHIKSENENLTNRMKLFEDQKADDRLYITQEKANFQKEKSDFQKEKAITISDFQNRRIDIDRIMNKFLAQDSLIRKLKK